MKCVSFPEEVFLDGGIQKKKYEWTVCLVSKLTRFRPNSNARCSQMHAVELFILGHLPEGRMPHETCFFWLRRRGVTFRRNKKRVLTNVSPQSRRRKLKLLTAMDLY
jgi:hypothetical protein